LAAVGDGDIGSTKVKCIESAVHDKIIIKLAFYLELILGYKFIMRTSYLAGAYARIQTRKKKYKPTKVYCALFYPYTAWQIPIVSHATI